MRRGWIVAVATLAPTLLSCVRSVSTLPPYLRPGEDHAPFGATPVALRGGPAGATERARVGDRVELTAPLPDGVDVFNAQIRLVFVDERGVETTSAGFVANNRAVARRRLEMVGVQRWRLALVGPSPGIERLLSDGTITVDQAPQGATRGPIRIDSREPHRLLTADNRPFWPRGESRFNVYDPRWSDSLDLEAYIARMRARGENALRVLVITDCEDEERPDRVQRGCIERTLGQFNDAEARLYDRILEAGERNGIYVILTLFARGFSEGKGETQSSFADNPYAKVNGGPAATARDFFTDPAARAAAARRVRYAAARWGAFDHLLAIDLLDEPERDGQIPESLWIPWVEEMSAVWRAADGGRHLVTVGSVGQHENVPETAREPREGSAPVSPLSTEIDERRLWSSGAVDIIQPHLDGKETTEVHALAHTVTRHVRESWSFDRPIVVGGLTWGGEPKPAFDHTHVGLFATLFSGAGALVHSAPAINAGHDEPMGDDRARHVRALAAVTARLGDAPLVPNRPRVLEPAGLAAWSLDGTRVHAIWLLAPEAGYGDPTTPARVTLAAEVAPGRWGLEWRDDDDPELRPLAPPIELESDGGPLTVSAPPFRRHAVGFLVRH